MKIDDQEEFSKGKSKIPYKWSFQRENPYKWYLNLFGEGSLGLVENLHGSSRVLRVDPAAGVTINSWSRCHQCLMFITSRKGKFLNDPTKNHQSYIIIIFIIIIIIIIIYIHVISNGESIVVK